MWVYVRFFKLQVSEHFGDEGNFWLDRNEIAVAALRLTAAGDQ